MQFSPLKRANSDGCDFDLYSSMTTHDRTKNTAIQENGAGQEKYHAPLKRSQSAPVRPHPLQLSYPSKQTAIAPSAASQYDFPPASTAQVGNTPARSSADPTQPALPASAAIEKNQFATLIENTQKRQLATPGMDFFFTFAGDAYFSEKRQVIDLGAGGGRDTRSLLAKNCQVIAVDISPTTKNVLESTRSNSLTVSIGTLQHACIESNSQDAINAQRVLPFIHGDDLDECLLEAARILKPGGYLNACFFGLNHSWCDGVDPKFKFHDVKAVLEVLEKANLKPKKWRVIDGAHITGNGEMVKNWEEIHMIAVKPA